MCGTEHGKRSRPYSKSPVARRKGKDKARHRSFLFRCTPKQLPMRACLLLILVSRALAILTKVVAYPGGLNGLAQTMD